MCVCDWQIDLEEFSDDFSRSFLANFLAKISPTGFGWVDEELKRMQRLDAMLQKQPAARSTLKDLLETEEGVTWTYACICVYWCVWVDVKVYEHEATKVKSKSQR